MKSFDSGISAQLANEVAGVYTWVELQFGSTYRYTDCDYPLYQTGNKYSRRGFKIDNAQYSSNLAVDSFDLEIDNVDLVISGIVLNEEVRNKTVLIGFTALGTDKQPIAFETMFSGFVGNWELAETFVRMSVYNKFALWAKPALRIAQASCPWDFKGDECGYSGAQTWCDKTYTRCTALGRTSNYGGFRWLKSTMESKIWWGRNPP